MFDPSDSRVVAVLGPTNTGKTYLAIERMLGHHSGMIGFPLRLLARENYDRVVKIKGASRVALVTGEEKIVPPGATYFMCTVESMPVDRDVDFLAIDEIQLCADAERGHIFTDRLLHARGRNETMFLGAETMRPLMKKLVPDAVFEQRPRFSKLSYAGEKKITRLPPRSAVVTFSATDVYAMAELLRRQRGGTAVVLGALSPRTRNAQVGMFEAGEVDYLVATDAIGMGLNLNLDHVAFARLRKFDGRIPRQLTAAEIGQIAGRAGRHMNDGTFGTTADAGPLPSELIEVVETHDFEMLRHVVWRNRELDMSSPKALQKSLQQRPPLPEMLRVRDSEDLAALISLSQDKEVLELATNPAAMRLLWDVCQVPDFRKILSDHHSRLLGRIFKYLAADGARLPDDWVAAQIARIDRIDGDIDSLVSRIADIRTWTYISHRGDWLEDAAGWQQKARAIEDRLSDALHERLTQRFVDKRAMVLARRNEGVEPLATIVASGEVMIEGESLGRLRGFRFDLDAAVSPDHARASLAAVRDVLAGEIPQRIVKFEQDNDGSFLLDREGKLTWRGAEVGRITAGETVLAPSVEIAASDYLDGPGRERLRQRLVAWLNRHLRAQLKPLFGLNAPELSGSARGVAYQMIEALGLIPRHAVARQISALSKADRKVLAELGVRIGRESIFMPALLNPKTAGLRSVLWATFAGLPVADLAGPGYEAPAPQADAAPQGDSGSEPEAGTRANSEPEEVSEPEATSEALAASETPADSALEVAQESAAEMPADAAADSSADPILADPVEAVPISADPASDAAGDDAAAAGEAPASGEAIAAEAAADQTAEKEAAQPSKSAPAVRKEPDFGLPHDGMLARSDKRSGRFFQAIGYRRFANRSGDAVLIKADALERVSNEAHKLAKEGAFALTQGLRSRGKCGDALLEILLPAIRFQRSRSEDGALAFVRKSRKTETRNAGGPDGRPDGRSEGKSDARPDGKRRGRGKPRSESPAPAGEVAAAAMGADGTGSGDAKASRRNRGGRSRTQKFDSQKSGNQNAAHKKSAQSNSGQTKSGQAKSGHKTAGNTRRSKPADRMDPDSPFAVLRNMSFSK
ncbi:helicase-related protein [Denitrobaculum tricleocarpae]|uniref:Helicase C-terminal domain-containing protein n=1 Tax=Denitrobaculum tricleocarpae TaxID=2591009 RepID=A0A545TQZ4_9PROT|nr:helicase-related protein [Denitrobaculum tricleocarpae]TQV79643.1 hypothetical protein FKG95_13065 [Denitrobaculum tricleocarpae]